MIPPRMPVTHPLHLGYREDQVTGPVEHHRAVTASVGLGGEAGSAANVKGVILTVGAGGAGGNGNKEYERLMSAKPPVYRDDADVNTGHVPTVETMLRELANIRSKKRQEYGDHYKRGGAVLSALFPQGVVLQTEEDFNRFKMIVYMTDKIHRYSVNLKAGGHDDSLDDLALYAMLCKECDLLARAKG